MPHQALERHLDIFSRLDSPDAYRALLGRFIGIYEPIEERLGLVERRCSLPLSLDGRRKTCLLARDLRALGHSAAEVAALPRCADLPPIVTPAEALGCLYVLEGATLGGQVIARLVARRFGFDRGSGCAFFASYGDRIGSMWREFGAALVTFADETGDDEVVVRSARAAFAAFDRWLAPCRGYAGGAA